MRPWNPSPGSGLSWSTILDVDFTAEANAVLSNGARTIDGVGFTVANAAAADTFSLVNGTGLRIAPKATSSLNAGTRSAPMLTLVMGDAGLDPDIGARAYWIQLVLGACNPAAEGDAIRLAIEETTPFNDRMVMSWGYLGGAKKAEHMRTLGGDDTTVRAAVASMPGALSLLHYGASNRGGYLTGTWSAASPRNDTEVATRATEDAAGASTIYANPVLTIAAQRNGSGTTLVCDVKRLVVMSLEIGG